LSAPELPFVNDSSEPMMPIGRSWQLNCESALKIDQEYGVSREPIQHVAAPVGVQSGRRFASAITSRSTILFVRSRSFVKYGITASRLPTDRITMWHVQISATRYGFAHTEIT